MNLYVVNKYSDTGEQLLNHTKVAFNTFGSLSSR